MRYSVIIPIYNAEKTLKRCVEGLLADNYPDCEIILVNDGSTDQSGEICRYFADTNANVKYINKEYGGVSSSRNAGLGEAEGKYILFADSDDYVEPDYFTKLDRVLAEGEPELVFLSFRLVGKQTYTAQLPEFSQVPSA